MKRFKTWTERMCRKNPAQFNDWKKKVFAYLLLEIKISQTELYATSNCKKSSILHTWKWEILKVMWQWVTVIKKSDAKLQFFSKYEKFLITNTDVSHHEVQDSQWLRYLLALKHLQKIHKPEIEMMEVLGEIDWWAKMKRKVILY